MKDLGERIKEYRTSMKMTQADFACRLGVTGASVSAYENGTRLPSYDILTQEQRGILQRTADLFADYNRLSGGGVSGEKEEQKGS